MTQKRCDWSTANPLMIEYHDKEWGVPMRDDKKQFEFLILETFQAGLSWNTILNKRENFAKAFDDFNYEKIALYDDKKFEMLQNNAGIIRNKLKIKAAITNAQAFIKMQEKYGSFSSYIWNFTRGKPVVNKWKKLRELPAKTELSDMISKDLKKHGFKFVGSTVIYAHLQATGIVNDHTVDCFRYKEIISNY